LAAIAELHERRRTRPLGESIGIAGRWPRHDGVPQALDLQPKNIAAREALEELRAAPHPEKATEASVLKRIFGR
jgi:hypothetical protein